MGAPGGSTLGALAARRGALLKQRKAWPGGAARGAPQAPPRANPNPPPPPQAPAQTAPAAAGDDRAARAQQAAEFLDAARASTQGQVGPPRAAPIRDESLRPTKTDTLGDRIDQLGGSTRSFGTQVHWIARGGG